MEKEKTLEGIASKLLNPKEKLIEAITDSVRSISVESVDSLLDGFHKRIRHFTDVVIEDFTMKLENENFDGYSLAESDFLKEEIYKIVLAFVREREMYMYKNGRYSFPYCQTKSD